MASRTAQGSDPKSTKQKSNKQGGASTHSVGVSQQFSSYLSHHRKVASETLGVLFAHWITSLMTWLVIGIAMALPALLYVLLTNMGQVGGDWHGSPKISLYLDTGIDVRVVKKMASRLEAAPYVKKVKFISPEAALIEFQQQSGFGEVLDSLPNNPLPAVIELEPKRRSSAEMQLQLVKLEAMDGVSSVSADLAWVERLFALVALAERFVTALSGILALGVLLAIGNTIRLAIESRRAEIEVVKLVGGTDSFVRRPFLYLGFWYGLGGAAAAWLMLQASLLFLSGPVEQLMNAYQHAFSLIGLGLIETLFLLFGGALLGILGALLAVARHLHLIEPS